MVKVENCIDAGKLRMKPEVSLFTFIQCSSSSIGSCSRNNATQQPQQPLGGAGRSTCTSSMSGKSAVCMVASRTISHSALQCDAIPPAPPHHLMHASFMLLSSCRP
jgi:hypothetical protein